MMPKCKRDMKQYVMGVVWDLEEYGNYNPYYMHVGLQTCKWIALEDMFLI